MSDDWHELYFFSDEPKVRKIVNIKAHANLLKESELDDLLGELAVPIEDSQIRTIDSNGYISALKKCGAEEVKCGPIHKYMTDGKVLYLKVFPWVSFITFRGNVDFDKLRKMLYN